MNRQAHARPSRRLAIVSLGALAFAFSFLIQPAGDNQNANYALVRAVANGEPYVDGSLHGPGSFTTADVVRHHGHEYAAKAPGLAFATVPAYAVLSAAGARTDGDPARPIWALHLWAVAVPALLLVLLVMRLGDRVEPGLGLTAAVALGVSTLLLPFANLFFVHVLATFLAFGAFALLWHERERGGDGSLLAAAAGLSAGLAVTTDYPLAIVALVLWAYAFVGRHAAGRRALAFGAGLAAGTLPLFAFNWWAFGSPTHMPYEGWHPPGEEPYGGFFGAGLPTLESTLQILFVAAGPAVLAPAVVGLIVLYRRGRRAESLAIAAVSALVIVHSAGSANPFGGASPGPRHLVPVLAFLAVPLAVAFRRLPGATVGLAAGGAVVMAIYTATTPLAAWDGHALDRFLAADFVPTALDLVGVTGPFTLVPFLLALGVAALVALGPVGRSALKPLEVGRGLAALLGWALAVQAARRLVFNGPSWGAPLMLALVAAIVGANVLLYRSWTMPVAFGGRAARQRQPTA